MKSKKLVAVLSLITFLFTMYFAGCAKQGPKEQVPDKSETGIKKAKVGIVLSSGGKGDKSFNDAALRGLELAKEKDIIDEYKYIEPSDISKDEESLRFLADEGYNLVIAVGFMMENSLKKVADEFPKVYFAIIDTVVEKPNVASLVFKDEEGSFLAGALAALVTESKMPLANDKTIVGFVGGMDMPLIHKFEAGYKQGVKYINPNIEVITNYAGTAPTAFNDPAKGKELAAAMYQKGADVVYHASGGTGAGVFEAAQGANVYAIGVDSDQNWMAPGYIIASMLKRVDVAVFDTVKAVAENKFESGIQVFNVKANGVGLTTLTELTVNEKQIKSEEQQKIIEMKNAIPKEIVDKIEQIRNDIAEGKISVEDVTTKK